MSDFLDAQEQNEKHPDTFYAPSQELLDLLTSDDQWVKVCENRERFWVEVKEVDGDKISGCVDNDLVFEHDFKCGDTINFEKRHILQMYK